VNEKHGIVYGKQQHSLRKHIPESSNKTTMGLLHHAGQNAVIVPGLHGIILTTTARTNKKEV